MKIDNDLVPISYKVSKRVYGGELKLKEGKEIIAAKGRMNLNSAADYINNFKYLLEGKRFTRTLNFYSMDYYLNRILLDYGRHGLSNSLLALSKHIEYYEGKQKSKMHKMRTLLSNYRFIEIPSEDNQIQANIIKQIINSKEKRSKILNDLKSYKSTDETHSKLTKVLIRKRDNSIIAKLKIIRGFKCQICETKIQKQDGNFYIEAAHIKPKNEQGSEEPNNILILCPNHHKEFDWGNVSILRHTNAEIKFRMNTRKYQISLNLE